MRPRRFHPLTGLARTLLVLGALALTLQTLGAAIHARTHSRGSEAIRHTSSTHAVRDTQTPACNAHHHADHAHHDHLAGASSEHVGGHGLLPAAPTPEDPADHDGHHEHGDCPICAKLIAGSRALIAPDAAPAFANSLVSASVEARREPAPRSSSPRPRSTRGPPLAA